MGWIRLSDDFYDNAKMGDVGPLGVALHVAAIGFCNRNLTDGYFKKNKALMFLDFDGIGITTAKGEMFAAGVDGDEAARLVVEWMVAGGLWHEADHGCVECHARADGGEPGPREFLIHDYLNYQPSRSEIEEKAESNRKRVEAWRATQKARNGVSNGERNAVGNALRTHVVQTPQPQPPPQPQQSLTPGGVKEKEGGCARGEPHLAANTEPPLRCPRHTNHTDAPACRGCKTARLAHDDWQSSQKTHELDIRRRRKQAITNCPLCDDRGIREISDTMTARCDHDAEQARHA